MSKNTCAARRKVTFLPHQPFLLSLYLSYFLTVLSSYIRLLIADLTFQLFITLGFYCALYILSYLLIEVCQLRSKYK